MADETPTVPCEPTPASSLADDGGDDFARPAAYGGTTSPRAVASFLGTPSRVDTTQDTPQSRDGC